MKVSIETAKLIYPVSDGKPMAETGIHVQAIVLLHQALEDFFHPRTDVFIASDMFWYWKEGRTKTTAPDVMVVPGVGNHDRRSFFTWEENGAVPAVVFEMASQGTWRNDLDGKRKLYERRGVKEYFIFDPEELYLRPQLLGFRLFGKRYRTLFAVNDSLGSELGFDMRPERKMLRLVNRQSNVPIPTRSERADAALVNAHTEKRRADGLQLEIDRLKSLLAQAGTPNGNGT